MSYYHIDAILVCEKLILLSFVNNVTYNTQKIKKVFS